MASRDWVDGRGPLLEIVQAVQLALLSAPSPGAALAGLEAAADDQAMADAIHRSAALALRRGDLSAARRLLDLAGALRCPPRCLLLALRRWQRQLAN